MSNQNVVVSQVKSDFGMSIKLTVSNSTPSRGSKAWSSRTLSPIVEDPDRAFMTNETREAARDVAKYFPTVIVSGRCIAEVYRFVRLSELYYAGSHGMDIKGPAPSKGGNQAAAVLFQPAKDFLPMMDEVYKALLEETKSTAGAKVEDNKFCLSVHFQCVDEKRWSGLAEQVRSVLKDYPKLGLTQGRKMMYSIPVYIGDDKTDEDAFKVLRKRGQEFGILVSKVLKETDASYSLQEPSEVTSFLRRLVAWKVVIVARTLGATRNYSLDCMIP
ncbi:hypothetical protein LguiB_001372 [Lonicera macranthoides]